MAKPASKYHQVHYRRMDGLPTDPTFEALCRAALSAPGNTSRKALWQRPEDRIQNLVDEPFSRQIVMNRVADLSSAVFGEICLVHVDDLQAMLRRSTTNVKLSELTVATVFDMSEAKAPEGTNFIRGTAYWLAIANHLFFIQLNSLTSRQLQEYLVWLIDPVAKSRGVSRSTQNFLVEIDISEVGENGLGDIKNLRIKGKSPLGIRVPVDQNGKPKRYSKRIADDHKVSEAAIPLIEAIIGKPKTQSLIASLGKGEYLSAQGEVKVSGRRTEASREQIRRIAHEVADETDAEVHVDGKYGKSKNGDVILRTKMPFLVPNDGGTLLDFDNVADQLQEVYGRFVQDGKIKA